LDLGDGDEVTDGKELAAKVFTHRFCLVLSIGSTADRPDSTKGGSLVN